MKPRYAVVFIQGRNNYNAYAPDVDGCISAAETWEEILTMMTEALTFHIETMLEDGEPIPESTSSINDAIAEFLEPIPDDVMRIVSSSSVSRSRRFLSRSRWSR